MAAEVREIEPPAERETGREQSPRPAREQAVSELAAALPAPHSFGAPRAVICAGLEARLRDHQGDRRDDQEAGDGAHDPLHLGLRLEPRRRA